MIEATWLTPDEWLDQATALEAEGWWLADLCGLDLIGLPRDPGVGESWHGAGFAEVPQETPSAAPRAGGARFEVVVQLRHHAKREARTIHVAAVGDPPTVPSVTGVWRSANYLEREAFDMFGIVFEGHPNLKRILMPDEWEGYPLRKDYGVGKVPVEFVPQPFMQVVGAGQSPRGSESGVELDQLGQVKRDRAVTIEAPPESTHRSAPGSSEETK